MPNEPETTIVFRLHARPGAPLHAQSPSSGRLPRVTQVMALALSFQEMLRTGEAPSYAALARTAGVTRERFSQVMKLLWLAPDIQREILELPPCSGTHPLTEYALRGILRHLWPTNAAIGAPLKRRYSEIARAHRNIQPRRGDSSGLFVSPT